MLSKFELTISTKYVPSWTYIEAFRELFQNAIDNELEFPDNKMEFRYNPLNGTICISNKTSVLELSSLLLGNSTKADNENTIGKHGEGYKIAFMVLLREGKRIKVYNYKKREIWDAKLVRSKRFNGELIPTIFVQKEAVWHKVPSNDLVIEVSNVAPEEYEQLKKKNLNLQDFVESVDIPNTGRILINTEKEKGNIYVKGLFICNNESLYYGYDLEPRLIKLDRDRRLVSDFDIQWCSSTLWKTAFSKGNLVDELTYLIDNDAPDVRYIVETYIPSTDGIMDRLGNLMANHFIQEYGMSSTPVTTTEDMSLAMSQGLKPVIVSKGMESILKFAQNTQVSSFEKKTLKERFTNFLEKIESKLTDEELAEFNSLIKEL